eukprot:1156723-Pelagomonas_calceolata.AAC.8
MRQAVQVEQIVAHVRVQATRRGLLEHTTARAGGCLGGGQCVIIAWVALGAICRKRLWGCGGDGSAACLRSSRLTWGWVAAAVDGAGVAAASVDAGLCGPQSRQHRRMRGLQASCLHTPGVRSCTVCHDGGSRYACTHQA